MFKAPRAKSRGASGTVFDCAELCQDWDGSIEEKIDSKFPIRVHSRQVAFFKPALGMDANFLRRVAPDGFN